MAGHGAERWPLAPFLAMVLGLAGAVVLSGLYTTYVVNSHSRMACPELRIQATAGNGLRLDTYEMAVRAADRKLYVLRCG